MVTPAGPRNGEVERPAPVTEEQLDIMARYLAEQLTRLLIEHEHLSTPQHDQFRLDR